MEVVQILKFRLDWKKIVIYEHFEPILIEIYQTGLVQYTIVSPLNLT